MKKMIFVAVLLTALLSCKKTEFAPEGPTDIRINNITSSTFTGLTVTMADTTISFGDISAHDTSDYYRFDIAYPKTEITCVIDGETYTTGPAPDIYMQYLGQNRITYLVYISNPTKKELSIYDVIYEEPLVIGEEQNVAGE